LLNDRKKIFAISALQKALEENRTLSLQELEDLFNAFGELVHIPEKELLTFIRNMSMCGVIHQNEVQQLLHKLTQILEDEQLSPSMVSAAIGADLIMRENGRIATKRAVIHDIVQKIVAPLSAERMRVAPTSERPAVDYCTVKFLGELYDILYDIRNVLKPDDRLIVTVLRDVNRIFLNPDYAEVLVSDDITQFPQLQFVEAYAQELQQTLAMLLRNTVALQKTGKFASVNQLTTALQQRFLIPLMQLLNIFNTMGRGVAVPEQEVAPIMQKLQDNGIVCENEITDVMNAIEASLTDTEAFSAAVVTRAMSPQLAVKEDGGIGSNRAIIRQIYSLDLMDSEGFDEERTATGARPKFIYNYASLRLMAELYKCLFQMSGSLREMDRAAVTVLNSIGQLFIKPDLKDTLNFNGTAELVPSHATQYELFNFRRIVEQLQRDPQVSV
uniref:Conserved oligomeric Golgi complex subunit 4 n=1 Tax=Soboliphyme baturini TaxID=241478 RepID=A0A183J6F6_9BILA